MNRMVLLGVTLVGLTQPPLIFCAEGDLEQQGFALLKKYCYDCHGVQFKGAPEFNVLKREALVGGKAKYVVAGQPDESYIWQRIHDGEMPPEKSPQPTAEEKTVIQKWISAGFVFPTAEEKKRKFKSVQSALTDILQDLQRTRQVDRPYVRYYTFVHLYNTPTVSDFDLRIYRAAFSKVLNSVSWEPDIVVPRAVDPERTIYAVDLRDIGFDRPQVWDSVLREYPYGLRFDRGRDEQLRELSRQIELLSGTPLAFVRGDWFAFEAAQPPLYHTLLDIPQTAYELERRLNVNVADDFQRNKLARAAFPESGVSSQNRLVDRHVAVHGVYWKSYDFARNDERGNLTRFPLGPKFAGNPFNEFAFVQAGGEIIFSLPNGLQGYMLVDGADKRIDIGPANVVADLNSTAGTVEVVNGISCMSCHKHGMIDFKDSVRDGSAVFGAALEKVQELFPRQEAMDRHLEKDRQRFLKALDEAIGPFVRIGNDERRPIDRFAEPVSTIAKFYYRDVSVESAAFELGLDDPKLLQFAVRTNSALQRLGLGPWQAGRTIKRDLWESKEHVISPFQATARELDLGTPHVFLGTRP